MADFFPALSEDHRAFIGRAPVFFVATATAAGRINLSPKGLDCLRILDAGAVAYLDLMGSGNETNAHLLADGRITLMFCAFDRPALILRLYGRGEAVLPQDARWRTLAPLFPPMPGVRQIFTVAIDSVQTSCGWAVPEMALVRERPTLVRYHAQGTAEALLPVMRARDRSIDGLPVRVPTALPDPAPPAG